MRARLEWSDVDLMRSILLFLDTQSWQDSEGSSTDDDRLCEIKSALLSITISFVLLLKLKVLTSLLFWMKLKILLTMLGLTSELHLIATARFGINCTVHLIQQSGQT